MDERIFGLQSWIDRLSEAELPALASVVQNLRHIAEQDAQVSVQQIAAVLLRDASLTSKVLRIANSVYYNPSQEPIRTISRAIVLIGFENVRSIALSVGLIDALLTRAPREQLLELLARSFHAAVQARNIAGYVLSKHQEEVFIAALLHHLGELAFWGCGGSQADSLAAILQQPGIDPEEAVRQTLGTSFHQLTLGLVKTWNLGETATLALSNAAQNDTAVRVVTLGVQISEAAPEGWDCEAMQKCVKELATLADISTEDAFQQILSSADEAVEVAKTFGAGRLCSLIPNTDPQQIRAQQEARRARLLQPNLEILQLALQELGQMATYRADIGRVLDILLTGLHQGAGLERVVVAVLADGQRNFRVKRAVGEGMERWQTEFELPTEPSDAPHLFSYVLRNREALWMGVPATHGLNDLITVPLRKWTGHGMFFIAPLLAGTREIGVLYADCRLSGRALKNEQFVAFQRFSKLTCRCLETLSKR